MKKPVATEVAEIRTFLAAGKKAGGKKLNVVLGLKRHTSGVINPLKIELIAGRSAILSLDKFIGIVVAYG